MKKSRIPFMLLFFLAVLPVGTTAQTARADRRFGHGAGRVPHRRAAVFVCRRGRYSDGIHGRPLPADRRGNRRVAGREVTTEYVPLSTEERFRAVADGRVDMHCGAATATLERRETVSFSVPIFVTGVSALVRADAPRFLVNVLAGQEAEVPPRLAVIQAFRHRTFGVRAGTTAETWLRSAIDTLAANAEVVAVDDHAAGIAGVASGELDAYFADRALLLGQLQQTDDPDQFLSGRGSSPTSPMRIALPRGDEDFRLLGRPHAQPLLPLRRVRAAVPEILRRPTNSAASCSLLVDPARLGPPVAPPRRDTATRSRSADHEKVQVSDGLHHPLRADRGGRRADLDHPGRPVRARVQRALGKDVPVPGTFTRSSRTRRARCDVLMAPIAGFYDPDDRHGARDRRGAVRADHRRLPRRGRRRPARSTPASAGSMKALTRPGDAG